MADEVDIANELMDNEVSRALGKLRQGQSNTKTAGTKTCMECGEKMPPPRRQLGFNLCVSCAEDAERRKTLYF